MLHRTHKQYNKLTVCCRQHCTLYMYCSYDIDLYFNYYQVLISSALSPRQKWQKLWHKYFLPCFSPSCGRNTFLPGRKPTLQLHPDVVPVYRTNPTQWTSSVQRAGRPSNGPRNRLQPDVPRRLAFSNF